MKILLCLLALALSAPVFADEWKVARLRGAVTEEVGGKWIPVHRGQVIPNDRYLKTGADGRIGLSRGTESIELASNTQIRIQDAGANMMTTVLQDYGVVAIEAERRNVQHFSVQTPYLTAVVKGTLFTVSVDASGASVRVDRGLVQVQDTIRDLVADIGRGQVASVTRQDPLLVAGGGAIAVFSFKGVQVTNGTTTELSAPGDWSDSKAGDIVRGQFKPGDASATSSGNSGSNGKSATINSASSAVGATAGTIGAAVATASSVVDAVTGPVSVAGGTVSAVVDPGAGSAVGGTVAAVVGGDVVSAVGKVVSSASGLLR